MSIYYIQVGAHRHIQANTDSLHGPIAWPLGGLGAVGAWAHARSVFLHVYVCLCTPLVYGVYSHMQIQCRTTLEFR
jgi:hypothetical protein